MACGYYKTDENGNVTKSPTLSKIIDYIDVQLETAGQVEPKAIRKMLVADGTITTSNTVPQVAQDLLMQELADLNAVSVLYYGASTPLLQITPFSKNGRPQYKVEVSQQAADTLSKNIAPKFPNTVSPYEFSLSAAEGMTSDDYLLAEDLRLAKAEQDLTKSMSMQAKANLPTGVEEGFEVLDKDIVKDIQGFIKAFAKAGITVQVKIDPTLDAKGRVVNTPGQPLTVVLNPTNISEDTHIHEFGHILIEMLGSNNVTVQRAIEELRGTNLYEEVKKAYPELDQDSLDKEVLVTALGLSGAKINRDNPNLFQKIYNRFVRALAKLFGVEANPSAVEKLTQMLVEKKYNRKDFKGSITFLMADSKLSRKEEEFMKIVDNIRIATQDTIDRLKRSPDGAHSTSIEKISLMQKRLDKITEVEQLIDFVNYAERLATKAEDSLESINERYSDTLSLQEKTQLLHELQKVSQWVTDFFGSSEHKSSIMQQILNVANKDLNKLKKGLRPEQLAEDATYQNLSNFEKKVSSAISRMNSVAETYKEINIPMMARLLFEFSDDDIKDEINLLISNIKTHNRLVALERDAEYEEIKSQKLGKEEEFKQLLALNIKQLEAKKIGVKTIENELREAQKDKSEFSTFLDPIVYSSQIGIQLFASMVKSKMYEANEVTQDDIYELAEAYKAFQAVKGSGIDPNKFNEDILEEVEYIMTNPQTGKQEKMKQLSFVQEFDVTRYKAEEAKMYKEVAAKFGKPEKGDEEIKEWLKNKQTVRNYYKEVANWYKDNSVVSADSEVEYNKLNEKFLQTRRRLYDENLKDVKLRDLDLIEYLQGEMTALDSLMNKMYDPVNKQWKISAVRPNDKYKNPKYTALKNNAPAFTYYQAMLSFYQKKQRLLGDNPLSKNSWEKFSYIVPSVRAEGLEKVQKDGAFTAAKDFAKDSFQFLSTDINYGDAINANKESRNKVVPIHYVTATESKYVSRDVASSLILFGGMANMFKSKSEITGSVMVMRDIIANREVLGVNSANIPVAHRLSKVLKHVKHEITGKGGNVSKHLNEWTDKIFFGEEELKTALNFFGKEISSNKLANKVASFTALANLAGNLLQSTNQTLIDNVRLLQEGHARQFFDKSDMAWAKKTYHFSSEGGIASLKDFKELAPKTKLIQAIRYFDALGEAMGLAREDRTGSKVLKAIQEAPMALQTLAEHETAVTRMLAMMHNFKGKLKDKDGNVIKNEDGDDATLWDVFIKDEKTGRFSIDPRVANFNKNKFIAKLSGVNKRTNQVKTKFDDALVQRRWYGKLLMLFRRYFIPTLRRHYGHNGLRGGIHRDIELGTVSEGTMETVWRLAKESLKHSGNFIKVYNMMTDMEKQNIRRVAVAASFWVAAAILLMVLSDDDDDDDSWAENFIIYQALRMQTELTQFVRPVEFLKTANSPTATVRPITKAIELIDLIAFKAMPSVVTGDTEGLYYERKSGIHDKGDSKLVAKFEAMIPIIGGIEKSADPKTAAKWFDLPATSTK